MQVVLGRKKVRIFLKWRELDLWPQLYLLEFVEVGKESDSLPDMMLMSCHSDQLFNQYWEKLPLHFQSKEKFEVRQEGKDLSDLRILFMPY